MISDSCQGVCEDNGDISTLWEWRLWHSDVKDYSAYTSVHQSEEPGASNGLFSFQVSESLESYFHHEVLMQSEANGIILLSEVISSDRSELLESSAARFI